MLKCSQFYPSQLQYFLKEEFIFLNIKKESIYMKNSNLSLVSDELGVYESSRRVNYLTASSTKGWTLTHSPSTTAFTLAEKSI